VAAIFLFLIQHPEFKRKAFEKIRVVMSGGAPFAGQPGSPIL
jgi:hypothetical protein